MTTYTAKEVEQKLAAGEKLHLVDVREDFEVAQGMIPGSAHINLQAIPEKLDQLDKDTEYILICRSGNRSGQAQQFLENNGYTAANMTGGMLDWEGPTE
ncbi:MAG TPA: rhodanese-like domain-containing protein [Pseudogracilibacillus sp.]|nr:rhodanese-like domain-containing protein [Pseudogracilibacillus sp.]